MHAVKYNLSNYLKIPIAILVTCNILANFKILWKTGCCKPTPLRVNLALEIRRDWKRFLETLP
jgi:hypothetical protein